LLLFNKPYNVLTQFTDKSARATLKDYIPFEDVYAAGRLDRDSEGLVVLTDSGALQHKITHPDHHMSKTYYVQVEGAPCAKQLSPIETGVELRDGLCRPAKCDIVTEPEWLWPRTPPIRVRKQIPDTWLRISLSEGRNRQVRRMCAAVGFPVLRLVRYRVGSWTIDGLDNGQWRWQSQ